MHNIQRMVIDFGKAKSDNKMALTDENNMVMPVTPMYGNGGFRQWHKNQYIEESKKLLEN